MDRFRELSVFVAVAEESAFNGAARKLGLSPPAVTRTVTALEERLGVTLFTRTTRRVALTDAGLRLKEAASEILEAVETAERTARGAFSSPVGELRVTAPVLFGQIYIAPCLRSWLSLHPQMQATARYLDRNVDLIEEGFDVAVRIGMLPDSGLTARKIGAVRWVVVASPEYLDRWGMPECPEDLKTHDIALPITVATRANWAFHLGKDRTSVELSPRLRVNTMTAAIDSALGGWGVTRVLSYQVAEAIADGRLVEIGQTWDDRRLPVHILHSEGRLTEAKIRSFIDHVRQNVAPEAERMLALYPATRV